MTGYGGRHYSKKKMCRPPGPHLQSDKYGLSDPVSNMPHIEFVISECETPKVCKYLGWLPYQSPMCWEISQAAMHLKQTWHKLLPSWNKAVSSLSCHGLACRYQVVQWHWSLLLFKEALAIRRQKPVWQEIWPTATPTGAKFTRKFSPPRKILPPPEL